MIKKVPANAKFVGTFYLFDRMMEKSELAFFSRDGLSCFSAYHKIMYYSK